MSYLVLARKYRPQTFADVIGQDHITNSLKKAIESGRVHHAYLFAGPRGIGKTTCARILAKELNATRAASQGEMLELDSGMDIIEIDAASNRGIDEIRTLRENVKFVPMSGRYKVYIIDEVHMLTNEAFNALLKTLEEPPEHVKFILATTDPNKLPMTVLSRCQQFTFKRIPLETISAQLRDVCANEGFKAEDEAIFAIAKAAQGSMRDALSILDQLISFSDKTVKAADVNGMLGLIETQLVFDMADAIACVDCEKALLILDTVLSAGRDFKQLNQNLIEHFRHLMIMKVGGEKLQSLIDYPRTHKEALFNQSGRFSIQTILRAIDIFIEVQETAKIIESGRLALELGIARLICSDQKDAREPVPVKNAAKPANVITPKPAAVAPVKEAPRAKPATPETGAFLKNNKGAVAVTLSPAPVTPPSAAVTPCSVTLEQIKKDWNALTFAVCQERISVGTYLQEGYPYAMSGNRITIAFTPDHAFHKECLDTMENMKIVGRALSGALKTEVSVELVIMDDTLRRANDSVVDEALDIFGGEVINEWHNKDK